MSSEWVQTSVGEIADRIFYGYTTKAIQDPDGVKFLRITDIQDGRVSWDCVPTCRIAKDKKHKYALKEGDIVFARTGATVGKSYLLKGAFPESVFASYLIKIELNPNVSQEYVYHFFQSPLYWRQINRSQIGSGQPNVNATILSKLNLPLPPISEQHRIVAKLEKLLEKVDKCKERLEKIPTILKRFRQSVLAAACSGELTADWREKYRNIESANLVIVHHSNKETITRRGVPDKVKKTDIIKGWEIPNSWGCFSAAELLRKGAFVDLKDGNHGSNHPKVSEFTIKGMPFITASQVHSNTIDYKSAPKLSGAPLRKLKVGFSKIGDVVYTHKGSVGRVAIADQLCVLSPQTTYYRVDERLINNRFLMYYLASPFFSEQVDVIKSQTTRDFVPITAQYKLFHRLPPLKEQYEIVLRIEALFKTADQIESRYCNAKNNVEDLTQSILAKAFRGELVPQDPNDEPASELLKRIQAEREQAKEKESKVQKTRKASQKRKKAIRKRGKSSVP